VLHGAFAGASGRIAHDDDFVAWPFVDEGYDYMKLFAEGKPLFDAPRTGATPRIAIVGAGAAGMVAAYELLRAGFKPEVFEASGRIGGRAWSQRFKGRPDKDAAIAEMGAMRVPKQNRVFFHYAKKLGLAYKKFPNPGTVPTTIRFEKDINFWEVDDEPPPPFADLRDDFDAFVRNLTESLYRPWRRKDLAEVDRVWQRYIDHYKDRSFREALLEGIPSWDATHLNAFGALGVGTGGFAPLYGICFLDILRLLIQQLEDDQQLIEDGISSLPEGLHELEAIWERKGPVSLCSERLVKCHRRVERVLFDRTISRPVVQWCDSRSHWGRRKIERDSFDAVIVATTTRAMEQLGLSEGGDAAPLPDEAIRGAIRRLHMVDSSKLFVRTQRKFWLDDHGHPRAGFPQTILTDGVPHAVYCLEYEDTKEGVVLMSYTWEDDASKIQALKPEQRFELFKERIREIHSEFAGELDSVERHDILSIDWQDQPEYSGAFKLHLPGQDADLRELYFQFQAKDDSDRGVYLAGDSVSWSGGWVEGALHTGINAAFAAARRASGVIPPESPLDMRADRFRY
jgi:tryptophan 2-monooxygenase